MRRIIIASIISAAIVAVGTVFGVRHYTQASTPVGLYEADVDHDGHVTILDLAAVARYYGQAAPLATATPPPQPREARIEMATTDGTVACLSNAPCAWKPINELSQAILTLTDFDPSRFPSTAQVTLDATLVAASPATACFRIAMQDTSASFDLALSTGTPIAGSEVCVVQPASMTPFRIESAPFTLPSGDHFYTPQFRADAPPATSSGNVIIEKLELVVRWTENVP